MTLDSMNKLADEYILSNGMVNYLYCFRNYLGDITGVGSSTGGGGSYGTGSFSTSPLATSSDAKPLHPWDYDYKREKHGNSVFLFLLLSRQAIAMLTSLSIV